MNVENLLRKGRNKIRGKKPHVAGEADEVHFCFVKRGDDEAIVGFAFEAFRRNNTGGESARSCAFDSGGGFAIAEDERNLRIWDAAGSDGVGERFEVRAAAA